MRNSFRVKLSGGGRGKIREVVRRRTGWAGWCHSLAVSTTPIEKLCKYGKPTGRVSHIHTAFQQGTRLGSGAEPQEPFRFGTYLSCQERTKETDGQGATAEDLRRRTDSNRIGQPADTENEVKQILSRQCIQSGAAIFTMPFNRAIIDRQAEDAVEGFADMTTDDKDLPNTVRRDGGQLFL